MHTNTVLTNMNPIVLLSCHYYMKQRICTFKIDIPVVFCTRFYMYVVLIQFHLSVNQSTMDRKTHWIYCMKYREDNTLQSVFRRIPVCWYCARRNHNNLIPFGAFVCACTKKYLRHTLMCKTLYLYFITYRK